MTDTIAIDPLAGLPADISANVARDHAAALVKGGGVTIESANASLAARGAAPLAAGSRDVAEAQRGALLNDDVFVRRYSEGDPEAIAKLFQADLRVQQSKGNLIDRPATPSDYNLCIADQLPADMPVVQLEAYGDELAKLVAAVGLPPANAQALVDAHLSAVKQTAGMSADERAAYGQRESRMLRDAIGPDAEERIKAASDKLTESSGRPLDIAKIVQSNGATVALTLIHQAEAG